MNRACQRQTAVLLTPAVRMIAAVPSPSAVASTIRARQEYFVRSKASFKRVCEATVPGPDGNLRNGIALERPIQHAPAQVRQE